MAELSKEGYESVLRMDHVVFDELSFERHGFSNTTASTTFQIRVGINKIRDGNYRVAVDSEATRTEEYTAHIRISGYFSIDEGSVNKELLLKQNAVAILFPYIRSELTLLTTQPETQPIILPVMNIAAMMDEAQELKADEIEQHPAKTN